MRLQIEAKYQWGCTVLDNMIIDNINTILRKLPQKQLIRILAFLTELYNDD